MLAGLRGIANDTRQTRAWYNFHSSIDAKPDGYHYQFQRPLASDGISGRNALLYVMF